MFSSCIPQLQPSEDCVSALFPTRGHKLSPTWSHVPHGPSPSKVSFPAQTFVSDLLMIVVLESSLGTTIRQPYPPCISCATFMSLSYIFCTHGGSFVLAADAETHLEHPGRLSFICLLERCIVFMLSLGIQSSQYHDTWRSELHLQDPTKRN